MKRNEFLGLAAFMVLLLTTGIKSVAQSKRVNFSGTWTINLEKCKFGDVPKWVYPAKMTIEQTADSIVQLSTGVNADGAEVKLTTSFSLDGKPVKAIVAEGKLIQQTTGVWSEDGKSLTKDAIYFPSDNPAQPQFGVLQVWTLSENGKSLLINSKREDANGKAIVNLVYQKR